MINEAEWLASARRDFSAFYTVATPEEVALMDALVLGHAALVVLINTPRDRLPIEIRDEFERAADAVEYLFTSNREAVRRCHTFCALPDAEQIAIERVIFNVKPPLFDSSD